MGMTWYTHVIPLLQTALLVSLLPGVLIVTYKELHGTWPGCLVDSLSPVVSIRLIQSNTVGVLWILSNKQCNQLGP